MQVLNYYKCGKAIPENAVYIARGQPHLGLPHSKFANPFKITDTDTREIVVEKYKKWLWEQIRSGKITLEDLLELENKDVLCFCAPAPCHGDVVVAAVKWARQKYDSIHGHWDW